MRSIGLTASVLITGCLHGGPPAARGTAMIEHPLAAHGNVRVGAVIADRSAEQFYGLPEGSLDNVATVTTATPEQVCVRVQLRRGINPAVPHDHELAALGMWRLALHGNGKTTEHYHVGSPELTVTPYDGQTMAAEHVGTTLACQQFDAQSRCVDAAWIQHWQVTQEAAKFQITSGTSEACFDNAGVLAASTKALELELTAPGASAPAMVFGWTFAPH